MAQTINGLTVNDGLVVNGGTVNNGPITFGAPKSVYNEVDFQKFSDGNQIDGTVGWQIGNWWKTAPTTLDAAPSVSPGRTNFFYHMAGVGQIIYFDVTPLVKGGCQLARILPAMEIGGTAIATVKASFGYCRQEGTGLGYTILTNDTQTFWNGSRRVTEFNFGSPAIAHGPLYSAAGWTAGPTWYSISLELTSLVGDINPVEWAIYSLPLIWTSDDVFKLAGAANY